MGVRVLWQTFVRLFSYEGIQERLTYLPTGKKYAAVDSRWGTADPTVVSLEIFTVFGVAPICCYVISQLIRNDPARHFWIIVLCTAELYAGYGSLPLAS